MPTSASSKSAAASSSSLVVTDLVAGYGQVQVLRGVSMQVAAGELVSVLGPNGAGKSTLLKAIMGAADVVSGDVLIDGEPRRRTKTHQLVRSGVGIVPEGRALVPDLTVEENLRLQLDALPGRRTASDAAAAFAETFELFPRLAERLTQLAGSMSGGEQQMLAIARALVARPRLLLLDEPSLGLAPRLIAQVFEALAEVNRRGLTVLVAEQNVAAATRVSSRSYVLSGGRVVLEGDSSEMNDAESIRSAFLGS
ncbi:ABC transporter ATP-binding protein [Nocardioides sp. 31GB23]|uniref:ABC transporter ATP-binding protein n=1 Tax=Nocardioides sp. 31GB23 TaxID=3156065 RepID=UPI0032AF811E